MVETIAEDEDGRVMLGILVDSVQTRLSQDPRHSDNGTWGSRAAARGKGVDSTGYVPRRGRGRPRKWTDVDDAKLNAWMNEGLDAPEIARLLERTPPDVERHIKTLRTGRHF